MSYKQAIKRICNILDHPEYPQITGNLIKFNLSKEIVGKCALGEISCGVGLKLDFNKQAYSYYSILEKAGVPKWLLEGANLPYMGRYDIKRCKHEFRENVFKFDGGAGSDLDDYIWILNDEGYTYSQISEFLRCTFL